MIRVLWRGGYKFYCCGEISACGGGGGGGGWGGGWLIKSTRQLIEKLIFDAWNKLIDASINLFNALDKLIDASINLFDASIN